MTSFSLADKRVYVAGHRGMVGSSLCRRLEREGCKTLVADRNELDLRDGRAVSAWFEAQRPQAIFLAAAKVGGIYANSSLPAEFIFDNLMIESNIIHSAYKTDCQKLLFLGSSCIYPKLAKQPIDENELLTGPLEPTNEFYAIAKIAGIKLAQAYRRQYGRDFISAMPTNLYGPGDNFDLLSSHVMPALIRKAHDAKVSGSRSLTVWGSGKPLREFLHVDDCADACVFLMKNYSGEQHVNVGSEEEISIFDLARLICRVVGYQGEIALDEDRPDGTPRKLMSSAKLRRLGWRPTISLKDGVERVYQWFLEHSAVSATTA